MALGGKREGAGRKKKPITVEKEVLRAYLLKRISEKQEDIVTAQIELATGTWIEKTSVEGTRIYKEKPDGRTGEYLLNQSVGKPQEKIEHSGAIETIIRPIQYGDIKPINKDNTSSTILLQTTEEKK